MKLYIAWITSIVVFATTAYGAELTPEQQRLMVLRENIRAAGSNAPLSRPQFQTLCSDSSSKDWCSGYIAALVTIHQIPLNCLPRTDMAPFMYGGLWEYTNAWLSKQAQDSTFTLYEAITSALSADDRCPIGATINFDPPDFVPYSEAEWLALRRFQEPTTVQTVEPSYPEQALQDGIEGWTIVSFTVTETGDVEDVLLVDSEPPELFDEVSLEAAAQFKFEPYSLRGKIIEVPNFQHVFRFEIKGSDPLKTGSSNLTP